MKSIRSHTAIGHLGGVLLLCSTICVSLSIAAGQSSSSGADAMQVPKILTDQELWGPDAFALFATLQRWKTAETSILIFPDRVVGGNKYESASAAEQTLSRLNAAAKAAPPKLRPEFQAAYRQNLSRAAAFKFRVERFLEDDSFHLVVQRDGGQFLKPGVPMRTVIDRYGKPEKTTTEVVNAQGDRRPAVLTVNWYAGGTIKFVQSDLSPKPETVDRVMLDLTAATAQIY
jgi:hypothetical protein